MPFYKIAGHLSAIFTVSMWSLTCIATKTLLLDFTPTDILLIRFTIGFIALKIIWPKGMPFTLKREPYFIVAGLLGVCMYFLIENYALTMTTACNVGIILAVAPLFTAITTRFFYPQEEKLTIKFFLGFIAAFSGIILLSVKGAADLSFNPVGDSLAVISGLVWAFYSVLTKKTNNFGYNAFNVTRRTFLYGIIFIMPFALFNGLDNITLTNMFKPINLTYILFLGIGASALCFASWNYAVKSIGALTTIVYIYATPSLTILFAYLLLGEMLTIEGFIGCALITMGLLISQGFTSTIIKKLKKSKVSGMRT
jgi:drug/metabolite transporter (DMT)-like permease